MSLEILLSRLTKVKRMGNHYMACCPAHDDKTPSLSIKDTGEGKLLINCLAGCETLTVLNAIGMDWEDVMPKKQATFSHPEKQIITASDGLAALRIESRIVLMCAFEMSKGRKLSDEGIERLKKAMNRINTISEMANNVAR